MSIISPWIIYLIAFLDNLSFAAIIGALAGFICLVIGVGCAAEAVDEQEKEMCNKVIKIGKWMAPICIALCILIPSKEEMYTMLIADTVTYEAVDAMGEGVKGTVD